MAGYTWQIDGGERLGVKRGDKVEVAMQNVSMMAHPMHLHGHHFQVVGIYGKSLQGAVRDTVLIPPMGSVVIAFDASIPAAGRFTAAIPCFG